MCDVYFIESFFINKINNRIVDIKIFYVEMFFFYLKSIKKERKSLFTQLIIKKNHTNTLQVNVNNTYKDHIVSINI